MFISPHEDYLKKLIPTMNASDKKICYVTFNKGYKYLKNYFPTNGLIKDLFFIDCVNSEEQSPNCKYISNLNLKEIAKETIKTVKQGYNFVIIDSLSNLIEKNPELYDNKIILKKFIEDFSKIINKKEGELLFICEKKYKESGFIQGALNSFNVYKSSLV